MKKLFLIPLLTCFTCVMAWGATVQVGDYQALEDAFDNAANGDVIEMTQDITIPVSFYNDGHMYNITKSITFDGKGYTLTGYSKRGSNKTTIAINQDGSNFVSVVFKDLIIRNAGANGRPIELRGNISSFTLDNVKIYATGSGNTQGLTVGGNQASSAEITISNSVISVGSAGYPIVSFNPYHLVATNTTFSGYCGLYLRGVDGSAGSRGTVIDAENCNFDCPNVHSGTSNAFSCFPLEDDGITINLHNCGMNIEQVGDQNQAFVTIGNTSTARHENPINITLSGDNSHFNTKGGLNKCIQNLWIQNTMSNKVDLPLINVTIEGGTYSVNPIPTAEEYSAGQAGMLYYGQWKKDGDGNYTGSVTLWGPDIPDTHEVQKINQGDVTLYRVVKKATTKTVGEDEVLYNLNELVVGEGVSEGVNPTSSFAVIDSIVLANSTTQAGYVVVGDTTTTGIMDSITVTVPENKTFVIKNGLDVKENAKVVAEPQSTIVIGEGGIITDNEESIIIEANENGGASLLLHPSITVNQTPELTIHMVVPAEHAGYEMNGSDKYRHWHRFAMPVEHMDATWEKNPNVATYLYGWDYSAQTWAQVGVTEMVPFAGYTLSPNREITNETGAITYIFKGKLLGNTNCTLNLNHHGYNFFGNSYTGYISILKLVDQIMGDAKIDGTVWMWNGEKYEGIGLEYLRQYENVPGMIKSWQKEVAPMQTFVLRLTGSELSSTDINYADAIWGNPRYENATAVATPSAAPTRHTQINDNAIISLSIAANGQKESIVLLENDDYSDAYDRGYDAVKYMNDNSFNSYVGVNGENYSTVATDNLEGKMLSINTNNELAYTMTFDFVAGEEYALRDNATNQVIAIEEGATYEFAAQPNSTVEGRFEIVSVAKMPTAIENAEVKANVKGIYTLTGQYLGENFEALPAGVYVVNGVKIVK